MTPRVNRKRVERILAMLRLETHATQTLELSSATLSTETGQLHRRRWHALPEVG